MIWQIQNIQASMSRATIFFLLVIASGLALILALLGLETLEYMFLTRLPRIVLNQVLGLALIMLGILLSGLAYRLRMEANLLRDYFGDEFASYARRVRKLIPGVW